MVTVLKLSSLKSVNICNFRLNYFPCMIRFLREMGRYFLMLQKVFSKPEKPHIYYKQTMHELVYLGVNSVGIISIISFLRSGKMGRHSTSSAILPATSRLFVSAEGRPL